MDRLLHDQFVGERIDKTSDGDDVGAAYRRVRRRPAGDIFHGKGTGHHRGNRRCRGWNKNQLDIETVLFVKLLLLGDVPIGVGRIDRAKRKGLLLHIRATPRASEHEARAESYNESSLKPIHSTSSKKPPCSIQVGEHELSRSYTRSLLHCKDLKV